MNKSIDRREFFKSVGSCGMMIATGSLFFAMGRDSAIPEVIDNDKSYKRYGLIESGHPLYSGSLRVIFNGEDITDRHINKMNDIEGWVRIFDCDIDNHILMPYSLRTLYGQVQVVVGDRRPIQESDYV